jgi:hypothetical protein
MMKKYVLYADDGARMHEYLFGSDEAGICFSFAYEACRNMFVMC